MPINDYSPLKLSGGAITQKTANQIISISTTLGATASAPLVKLSNSNSAHDEAILRIDSATNGVQGVYINTTGSAGGLRVGGTTAGSPAIYLPVSQVFTGVNNNSLFVIDNVNASTSGTMIYVSSASNAAANAPMALLQATNAAFDQPLLKLASNSSTASGSRFVYNDGSIDRFTIAADGTTYINSGINDSYALRLDPAGTGSHLYLSGVTTNPTRVEGYVLYNETTHKLIYADNSAYRSLAYDLQTAHDGGNTITVPDTAGVTGITITQNDTTNNPAGLLVVNSTSGDAIIGKSTGTGGVFTARDSSNANFFEIGQALTTFNAASLYGFIGSHSNGDQANLMGTIDAGGGNIVTADISRIIPTGGVGVIKQVLDSSGFVISSLDSFDGLSLGDDNSDTAGVGSRGIKVYAGDTAGGLRFLVDGATGNTILTDATGTSTFGLTVQATASGGKPAVQLTNHDVTAGMGLIASNDGGLPNDLYLIGGTSGNTFISSINGNVKIYNGTFGGLVELATFNAGSVVINEASNDIDFRVETNGNANAFVIDAGAETATFGVPVLRSTQSNITASTTQTQGQGALTKDVNEIAVCANPGDTVTLPTAIAGMEVVIVNNGANLASVFPASGAAIGANGANNAIGLAAASVAYCTAITSTLWAVTIDSQE